MTRLCHSLQRDRDSGWVGGQVLPPGACPCGLLSEEKKEEAHRLAAQAA